MSLIIKVTHVPTGQQWDSGKFPDEDKDKLIQITHESDEFYITHPTEGTTFFKRDFLRDCVIQVRRVGP